MISDSIEKELFLLLKEVLEVDNVDINQNMDNVPEWNSLKHIQLMLTVLWYCYQVLSALLR